MCSHNQVLSPQTQTAGHKSLIACINYERLTLYGIWNPKLSLKNCPVCTLYPTTYWYWVTSLSRQNERPTENREVWKRRTYLLVGYIDLSPAILNRAIFASASHVPRALKKENLLFAVILCFNEILHKSLLRPNFDSVANLILVTEYDNSFYIDFVLKA